jgi:monomeric sarcosine oxidase
MLGEFDVIVVGGGVNGLCAAWWLSRRGAHVAVVEQHALGHDRGSSHGRSRITRSAYSDADYVRLMQVAHGEAWPALESDAGAPLRTKRDGCFFGPIDGPFQDYVAAVGAVDVDAEVIEGAEARRRFPMFRFPPGVAAVHDRTAAVVAAADTMAALGRVLRARGVVVIEGAGVERLDAERGRVETTAGPLFAERIIVAAGPWTDRILPGLKPRLTPVRQTVGYFDVPGAADFPVWAWRGVGDFYYGLPAFQRPGLKAANHRTSGVADDPDTDGTLAVDDVRAFLAEHLTAPVGELLAVENCFYTNTDDEDFVLDRVPGAGNMVVAAGMSGHGFKFGPLTGRILAELALDGVTSVPEFEACRARFAWGV